MHSKKQNKQQQKKAHQGNQRGGKVLETGMTSLTDYKHKNTLNRDGSFIFHLELQLTVQPQPCIAFGKCET